MKIKLVSLKEIEGAISPHQAQLDRAMKVRLPALEFVNDLNALAGFIGGRVESLGLKEDWGLSKEVFPGVEVSLFIIGRTTSFPPICGFFSAGRNLICYRVKI